ncbi:MAG: site-specific DNA-methyltransferase, partial [Chloroflexi bacterium]|nr:site-specific DNA-methyltransferase [Chloroflexota bacterium]
MTDSRQLSLPFGDSNSSSQQYYFGREIGTFKDSQRAPIYGWFRYPAGYSYKFVRESLDLFNVSGSDWVYDPFSGTGTTLICAKQHGINSYGVEAHSFVHWVAAVKLYWEFDYERLRQEIIDFLQRAKEAVEQTRGDVDIQDVFPELVYKCYHPLDLKVLYLLRKLVASVDDQHLSNLLKLGLTDTLRGAAAAGTGWPYISPRKNNGEKPAKDAFAVFSNTVWQMYKDLLSVAELAHECETYNVLGDSRLQQPLPDAHFQLALTSPPYLNNYDYADRTRLETYFWGIADSWGDITEKFRDRLMVAATTQVTRRDYEIESALNEEIQDLAPEVYLTVQKAVLELAKVRLQKGGKKDYDLMTALYFNGIFQTLKETYRLLKHDAHFCLVLGDSAPY